MPTMVESAMVTLETTLGGGIGDDGLHAADVVREARLNLAGARVGEELERHALQVRVELVAQVAHHTLADARVEAGLPDADHAGDDRRDDHHGDEEGEQFEVLLAKANRDRKFEHIGVDDAKPATTMIAASTTPTARR